MPDREKPLNSPGYSRRRSPESAPTARTAFGRMEAAVQAIHAGAYDSKSYCVHTASFPQEPTTAAIGNDSKSYCVHTASFPRPPTTVAIGATFRVRAATMGSDSKSYCAHTASFPRAPTTAAIGDGSKSFCGRAPCRRDWQQLEIFLCSHSIISTCTNCLRQDGQRFEILLRSHSAISARAPRATSAHAWATIRICSVRAAALRGRRGGTILRRSLNSRILVGQPSNGVSER